MSNLTNWFGGGGGSVPLRGLVSFPHNTPSKITHGGMVFLRSGYSEVVDYDPSLQPWVNDNIMFINTRHDKPGVTGNAIRSTAVDTDGAGKWMVGGWQFVNGNTLPRLYYSSDDAETWSPLALPTLVGGAGIQGIKAGMAGVWLVTVKSVSGVVLYRTTNNGQNWTDITSTALGSSFNSVTAIETDRAGVWLASFGPDTTFIRRSANDGASWSNVNAPQGIYRLREGADSWLGLLTSPTSFSSMVVSTDRGLTWTAPPVAFGADDVIYSGLHGWLAWKNNNGFYKPNNPSTTFDGWSLHHVDYGDMAWDATGANATPSVLNVGLDDSLWLHYNNSSFRSGDGGETWTKYDVRFDYVAAGPNKRTVGVKTREGSLNGLDTGILTGRPAAGVPYSNNGRITTNSEVGQRTVNYVRIK